MSRRRGLTMIELMVALTILFLASTFIMGMLAFGSRLPLHAQRNTAKANLAQQLMDERLSQPFATPVVNEPRAPVPGHPGYEFQVEVASAGFDPEVNLVTLTVYPPEGNALAVRAVRPPDPVTLGESLSTTTYDCFSCHSAASRPDLGPGGAGPDWNPVQLATEAANAGFGSDVEGYIRDSIRNPDAYETAGWTSTMQAYPDIVNMPDEDLDAIVEFMTSL